MSQEINPCDDFYQYLCSPTKDSNKYGKTKETTSRLKAIVKKQINNLIRETLIWEENVWSRALKNMFRVCLDGKTKRKQLDEVYLAVVQWGLLKHKTDNFHWLEFIRMAREHGLGYDLFFDISVVDNVAGNGEPILRVCINLTNLTVTIKYKFQIGPPPLIARTSQSKEEAAFLKNLDEVFECVIYFRRFNFLSQIIRKGLSTYKSDFKTIQDFEETYGFSPWMVLPNASVDISDNTTILVASSDYFFELADLIVETEER